MPIPGIIKNVTKEEISKDSKSSGDVLNKPFIKGRYINAACAINTTPIPRNR